MYFSSREKQILKLLVAYTDGITQNELVDLLQISKRTLYREMSSIEKSLKEYEIEVIKPRGKGYRLIGEEKQLTELKDLLEEESVPLANVPRQSALASSLLLANEEQTIEGLALDFAVSPSTITSDLLAVEESLKEYSLRLERKKARGIMISGSEYARRQLLGNMIYRGIGEYEFFNYVTHVLPTTKASSNFFINLITPQAFYYAKKVILEELKSLFVEVTDNQVQQIIIILALSIDRIQAGFLLEPQKLQVEVSTEMLVISKQIAAELKQEMGMEISAEEQLFFARQLEGVNYKKPQNIFLEDFDVELSYQVRELIRMVSKKIETDFRVDDALYYDLLTHLSAAFKRMIDLGQLASNPLLDKVVEEYQGLTQALQEAIAVLFPDKPFSQDELAYLVIHFAASLERNPSKKSISTLVLCSSGIGTARILESRLQKYIPEIDHISIIRLSQLNHVDFKAYDLILSTIFLPDFNYPYKLISPLLLDDEIKKIKKEIRDKRFGTKIHAPTLIAKEAASSFEQIYEMMKVGNDLLTRLEVNDVQSGITLKATLDEIIAELEGIIVTDADQVSQLVIKRHETAPIGIPDTNLALFHSANQYVKHPYFSIFDLNRPIPILGMDRKPMALTRMLLMLAPEKMTSAEEQLLSLISASVIENDLNMEIYQKGSKKQIFGLLSALFVNKVKELEADNAS